MSSRGLTAVDVEGKFLWEFSAIAGRLKVVSQGSLSESIKQHINSLGPVYNEGMVAYSSGHGFHLVLATDGSLLRQLVIRTPGVDEFKSSTSQHHPRGINH